MHKKTNYIICKLQTPIESDNILFIQLTKFRNRGKITD